MVKDITNMITVMVLVRMHPGRTPPKAEAGVKAAGNYAKEECQAGFLHMDCPSVPALTGMGVVLQFHPQCPMWLCRK